MPNCERCGKQFHACDSCGLLYDWERKYCGETCYTSSTEHFNVVKELFLTMQSFSNEEIDKIIEVFGVFDDSGYSISDFIYILNEFKNEE